MSDPRNPIEAVIHPDPYPYYARLVAERPLHRDAALGCWVAASADAVTDVLASARCRVRPADEAVPRALAGSPAGEIFGRLVRMNDGPGHTPLKQAVSATLAGIDLAPVALEARRRARELVNRLGVRDTRAPLADFACELSVHVLGGLLGIEDSALPDTARWMADFARCLAPGSAADEIERGKTAAGRLLELGASVSRAGAGGLFSTLAAHARNTGRAEPGAIVANGIGLMSQAYDATAGLIGNTLLALAARPELRARVPADPGLLAGVVQEVLRADPPVQNTRRFIAADGPVAGQAMRAGDTVLVVLAAANRDPAANPEPERFDPLRAARRLFTFGAGVHACPGEALAAAIAQAGVEALLEADAAPRRIVGAVAYRPSANARIPLLGRGETQ